VPHTSTHERGRAFEAAVVRHLSAHGWQVIDRNLRFHRNEIDLVARKEDVIAFIEVKGRRGGSHGHPLEAITWRKRRAIEAVASSWIQRFGKPYFVYRFDAVSVIRDTGGRLLVEHVEDAWRLG
jgi:putative endonuclease